MKRIAVPKSKEQEKVVKAFLTSLEIVFHSDEEEDAALYKAMQRGRKTKLLNADEKDAFLLRLNGQIESNNPAIVRERFNQTSCVFTK